MDRTSQIDQRTAWAAIVARDARLDGRFVYAVRTTGVVCRPSCASRRPLRENVEIFPDVQRAVRAGYRRCARCGAEPVAAGGAVERAVVFLEAHLEENVTLRDLGAAVGLSPAHLQRAFTRALGLSPRAFQQQRRLARWKARIRGGASVGEATYAAGYGSSRALYEGARAGLGMTPAAYRRGGRGEQIRYAVVPTDVGRLLVATTARGVCAVELGDDDAILAAELGREFPRAELIHDEGAAEAWTREIAAATAGAGAAVPLDLRGTAFQLRVWRALRDIPRGETRSYAEVAARIGCPTGARAVARACAANRVALLVPCHRVVRGTGDAGGYRWGAERKERLLAAEREPRQAGEGRTLGARRRRSPA